MTSQNPVTPFILSTNATPTKIVSDKDDLDHLQTDHTQTAKSSSVPSEKAPNPLSPKRELTKKKTPNSSTNSTGKNNVADQSNNIDNQNNNNKQNAGKESRPVLSQEEKQRLRQERKQEKQKQKEQKKTVVHPWQAEKQQKKQECAKNSSAAPNKNNKSESLSDEVPELDPVPTNDHYFRATGVRERDILMHQSNTILGTLGHVNHGKSSLVESLSGIKPLKYSEEKMHSRTIKLGYANFKVWKCPSCPKPRCYSSTGAADMQRECAHCQTPTKLVRHFSFVDCPGHEMLMSTMLNGSCIMHGALLVLAADNAVPQPQAKEHLAAAQVMEIPHLVPIQTKVDLVSREAAIKNALQIRHFLNPAPSISPHAKKASSKKTTSKTLSSKKESLGPSKNSLSDSTNSLSNSTNSFSNSTNSLSNSTNSFSNSTNSLSNSANSSSKWSLARNSNKVVIPVACTPLRKANLDVLLNYLIDTIPTPSADLQSPAFVRIVRSFDVNSVGCAVDTLVGGIAGGTLLRGFLRVGDQLELRPGLIRKVRDSKTGKSTFEVRPLRTKVTSLSSEKHQLSLAVPGGLLGIGTLLDPCLCKGDRLVGQVLGAPETLPGIFSVFQATVELFDKIQVGQLETAVPALKKGQVLSVNVGAKACKAAVSAVHPKEPNVVQITLEEPVCCDLEEKITLSCKFPSSGWRLIGKAVIKKANFIHL